MLPLWGYLQDCPFRSRSAPSETIGNKAVNNAAPNKGGTTGTTSITSKNIAMHDKECKLSVDAISKNPKIEDAVDQVIATLHAIKPESVDSDFWLGLVLSSLHSLL